MCFCRNSANWITHHPTNLVVGGHFPAQKIKIALNNQSRYVLPKIEFAWKRCRKSQSWKSQKIKILKNCKKRLEILSFYASTKNNDHMLYCSWEMARDGCNFYFSFWTIFCPSTPITCPKNKYFKKNKKTPGNIIILHKCTKNHDDMLYCSWDMVCDKCNCRF